MNARDLMSRDIVTITPETTTRDAARILVENGIGVVPVVDETGAPLGIVSEADLIGSDRAEPLSDPTRTAREIMSFPLIAITENAEVHEIAHLLGGHRVQCLPVIRDERIIGIISRTDILRVLAADQDSGNRERAAA